MDTPQKLSPTTIFLHWIIALTMIALTTIGFYMALDHVYALYDWHKALGVIIFAFILVRVWWRIKNRWPVPVREYPPLEHRLAHIMHWVLIISTVLMPISGMMMSGIGGHGIHIFGWSLVPENLNPTTGEAIAFNLTLSQLGEETHEILGYILAVAIVLHAVGAIKHHIIDKDCTLRRMIGH